jgi:hypothetical protein
MKISYRKLAVSNFHRVAKHFTTPEVFMLVVWLLQYANHAFKLKTE